MYTFDWTGDFRAWLGRVGQRDTWRRVAPNVWFLGLTSLLTDVSSEMVASVLPLYLVLNLGMSPFVFGLVDGLYPGVTALVRWGGGLLGDYTSRHKYLAAAGYALSAASRAAWLGAGSHAGLVAATVTADRIGKGVRTAPRDALISLSAGRATLGGAFGVHRALDAAGAMLGPLVAVSLLAQLPGRFDLVFVVSFGFGIVGLTVLLLFVRDGPARAHGLPGQPLHHQVARLLRRRYLWAATLGSTVLAACTISDAFIYLLLERQGHVPAHLLPLLFVGTSAAYLTLAVPFGALADRVPRWQVFLGGHVLLGAVYATVLSPGLGAAGVVAVMALLGGYYAATDGVLPALASAVLPAELRGSGLGFIATATSLGRLVASVAFGWLWTVRGSDTAVLVFGVGLLAAMFIGWRTLASAEREIIDA